MAELKRVEPEEILFERGEVSLTPLQRVGAHGTLVVGVVGTVVLLMLLIRWIWLEPAVPQIPQSLEEKLAGAILSRYKELHTLNLDSTVKMIDTIVVRILLPVFTIFVGYIFGSQTGSRSS
jgi:hypothetical protein